MQFYKLRLGIILSWCLNLAMVTSFHLSKVSSTFSVSPAASSQSRLLMTSLSFSSSCSKNKQLVSRQSFISNLFLDCTSSITLMTLLSNSLPVNAQEDATTKTNAPPATFALRRAGALPPSLTPLSPNALGILVRFGEDILYTNNGSRTSGKDVFVNFDFPSDWLQLDRSLGGVHYVDQRNGDKMYLLKVPLPMGIQRLEDVPKAYIGDAIFHPDGELIRTGNNVEDYKVLSSKTLVASGNDNHGDDDASVRLLKSNPLSRRRFNVKYTTLTGNNFTVERKGIVDAYEYGGMIYMLMTGSNAVLFDKKGRERDTVEYISDSFHVQPVYTYGNN